MAWARDPTRSASFGIDPFRLRSGIWMQLAPAERKQLYVALRKEIETTIPVLEQYLGETDQVEAVRAELGLATQRARLEILTRWTRGMPSTQRKKMRQTDTSRSRKRRSLGDAKSVRDLIRDPERVNRGEPGANGLCEI